MHGAEALPNISKPSSVVARGFGPVTCSGDGVPPSAAVGCSAVIHFCGYCDSPGVLRYSKYSTPHVKIYQITHWNFVPPRQKARVIKRDLTYFDVPFVGGSHTCQLVF